MFSMSSAPNFHELALELGRGSIDPRRLRKKIRAFPALPALDAQLLEELADQIERASLDNPRYGWALAMLFDTVARQSGIRAWEASTAFHLAQAANALVRPRWVGQAALRARRLFLSLEMADWAAAADWQLYDQPWTRPDFLGAANVLETALKKLRAGRLRPYAPHARRSLAYALILRGDFAAADRNLAKAEKDFRGRGDPRNLGRCWLYRAGLLRRRGEYAAARRWLDRARDLFLQQAATVALAQVDYQLAILDLFWKTDLEAARTRFEMARNTFQIAGLPLWRALCDNGLAQVHTRAGDLRQAQRSLQQAQIAFARHGVLGALADNLIDSAQLEMASGRYQLAVEKNREAEILYLKIGVRHMAHVARMYQGESWAQLGRYQTALSQLEQAQQAFSQGAQSDRLAECENLLAQVWLRLNNPGQARPHLERALDWYRQTENASYLALTYAGLAQAAARLDDHAQSILYLQAGLVVAEQASLSPLVAFIHRLVGETYQATGQHHRAADQLCRAADLFREQRMPTEEAFCRARLGYSLLELTRPDLARHEWNRTLALSADSLPEVDWQALGGLAELAERDGGLDEALNHWSRMVQAMSRLRLGFTQPSLYGSYSADQQSSLHPAIAAAARYERPLTSLAFIEESKALILANQIAGRSAKIRTRSSELEELRAEIVWQRTAISRMHASGATIFQTAHDRRLLADRTHSYERLSTRLERASEDVADFPAEGRFSIDRFRASAAQVFGHDWLAVDYFQTGEEIICVWFTSSEAAALTIPLTPRLRLLLDDCRKAHRPGYILAPQDLADLGAALIPQELAARLAPDLHVLLSPHAGLHAVPFASLRVRRGEEFDAAFLVEHCVPVVTPSLHTFSILQNRPPAQAERKNGRGLLLAAGQFQGRHPELPQIVEETRVLKELFNEDLDLIEGPEATWENLLALAKADGGLHAAFLHLATHAFHDNRTARASGFALYDRDIWLENLWELAPLPPLVTFSACNGARSLIHPGDEPDGLAATCLSAGARTVIGSLWPLLDAISAQRMADFYSATRIGNGPARALALSLRAAIRRGEAPELWGGLQCLGTGG